MFGTAKDFAADILKGGKGIKEVEVEEEDGKGDDQGLEAAANELIDAVKAGDAGAVAEALRNAFAILDADDAE